MTRTRSERDAALTFSASHDSRGTRPSRRRAGRDGTRPGHDETSPRYERRPLIYRIRHLSLARPSSTCQLVDRPSGYAASPSLRYIPLRRVSRRCVASRYVASPDASPGHLALRAATLQPHHDSRAPARSTHRAFARCTPRTPRDATHERRTYYIQFDMYVVHMVTWNSMYLRVSTLRVSTRIMIRRRGETSSALDVESQR
ncbi:hypothetical protein B0H12DRAFT_328143 [Mycena haematopus]|nr:hypothetical protein B0H12DRAFT_328143 [Mycena haematopus]